MLTWDRFKQFLDQGFLLQLVLAVYLGTAFMAFFSTVVDSAVMPALMKICFDGRHPDDIDTNVSGVNVKIGNIIVDAVKLIVGALFAYYFTLFTVGISGRN